MQEIDVAGQHLHIRSHTFLLSIQIAYRHVACLPQQLISCSCEQACILALQIYGDLTIIATDSVALEEKEGGTGRLWDTLL